MFRLQQLKVGTRITTVLIALAMLASAAGIVAFAQIFALRAELRAVPPYMATRLELAEWREQTAINAARTVAIIASEDAQLGERLASAIKETSARISELPRSRCGCPTLLREESPRFEFGPSAQERAMALRFLETQSLAAYCRVLLNANEFVYVP